MRAPTTAVANNTSTSGALAVTDDPADPHVVPIVDCERHDEHEHERAEHQACPRTGGCVLVHGVRG